MGRSLQQRVFALVHELRPEVPKASVTESAVLSTDLGFDSFSLMALAVRLHEEVGVDLAELALRAADIRTVGDLTTTLDSLDHARH